MSGVGRSLAPAATINEQRSSTNDLLNRLTAVKRNGAAYQSWNLDSQGNWSSSTTGTVTQTRTANAQNQITSISGTAGTPVYDSNGNMTTDQNGNKLVYDAWNRLVSVTNSAGQIIAAYTYDARGYRVSESYPIGGNGVAAGTVNYIYYDANWQAIETRTNGTAASDVTSQMVWSAAYINAAILQDTYTTGVIQPNSRLYYLQDANWDTTAVVGFNGTAGSWGVTQRYVYSPYGSITVLNADWTTPPAGTQPVVNNLYQGMTLDAVTGLYYERFRNYSPSLGTWISQDPLSYVNGANTYQFVGSGPVDAADPWGLWYWENPVTNWLGQGIYEITHPPAYVLQSQLDKISQQVTEGGPPVPPSGWERAIDNLSRWIGGHGGVSHYGPSSFYSKQMSQSSIGKRLVEFYLNKFKGQPCDKWGGVTDFKGTFGLSGLFGNLGNGTAEFVGSATGEASTVHVHCKGGKGDVEADFRLTNTTSLKSLLYGLSPNSMNVTTAGWPFANWVQTYDWIQDFSCDCCHPL